MKENYILVKGITQEKVLEVVQEFINLYAVDINPVTTTCSVFNSNGDFIISGLENFDFFLFSYMINFLNYPVETHYLGKSPDVKGYFYPETVKERYPFSAEEVVQVFNLGTIEDPASVIVSTMEDSHFFFDFDGRTTVCNEEFSAFEKHERIKEALITQVVISPHLLVCNQKPWWKFW